MLGNSEIFPASSIVVMNVLPCVSTHFERQYIIVSNMYKQGSDKNSSSLNARDRSDRSFCSLKSLRKAAFPQLPHNVISDLFHDGISQSLASVALTPATKERMASEAFQQNLFTSELRFSFYQNHLDFLIPVILKWMIVEPAIFLYCACGRYNLGKVLEALGDCQRASDCMATALQVDAVSPLLPYSSIPITFE
ncbi:Tetratricopeptide repeat protein 7B [Homalodisca vitripennis]|nr:Tetratricopeptide repeat protein 7B [Homalodisca vitripennis]